ncbi:serine--tRNA ligase [Tissierella creatinophila]|uniref:Serine--tRNA ligase n=1 Tax=Tissierella creatinophila DSM 6911 TaxID=1123403 RepID=A0A1U7M861_TISCR|nr:serine--tRNA ligase [Tissierella creatinophila]OLS03440.1 serine--tRNA ligase [Tissierella creatinophila DSM 6911]
MLDIKRIRMNAKEVKEALEKRHGSFPIDEVIQIDEKRRNLLIEVEEMKAKQNSVSKEIPKLKKEGKDVAEVLEEMKSLSDKVKEKDILVKEIDEKLKALLLEIPNTPHESVVIGKSDEDNVEIRKFGEPRKFDFEIKAHWDIGTDLDILDFERASKITGARFTVFKGLGAKLERAIMSFMLDTHTSEHGYTEMLTPFMVNRDSMIGTGQLPKFENDMFHLPEKDYFLVPTAEVPLTNLHRDEILEGENLPVYYTGYTPCFRQEAGAAGRDTRGLIRNHQFDKVELVKLVKPESSYDELEKLTKNAEEILKLLNIPYRVVMLSSGDLGFSSAKTYDIEVWMPSYDRYVEISSCSNFEDFQARRTNLRFRNDKTSKVEYLHTLNGSGLAVGRTFAAILENYQQEDGSVIVPEVLRPYLRNIEKIQK